MTFDKLSPEGFSIGIHQRTLDNRYQGEPSMTRHSKLMSLVDEVGFRAAWLRDIPLYNPKFGDVAQVFEIFTYLGFLASHTKNILLGTAAIVLPLREPWIVRKAYNTMQHLSNNKFLLGVASEDRPIEYPLFEKFWK